MGLPARDSYGAAVFCWVVALPGRRCLGAATRRFTSRNCTSPRWLPLRVPWVPTVIFALYFTLSVSSGRHATKRSATRRFPVIVSKGYRAGRQWSRGFHDRQDHEWDGQAVAGAARSRRDVRVPPCSRAQGFSMLDETQLDRIVTIDMRL